MIAVRTEVLFAQPLAPSLHLEEIERTLFLQQPRAGLLAGTPSGRSYPTVPTDCLDGDVSPWLRRRKKELRLSLD
jgi:hypothetical protein